MRTAYITFDGTEFETEQECKNYEEDFKDALTSKAVILFDDEFNMLFWNGDISEIEYGIYYIFIVDTDKCVDVFNKLETAISFIRPSVPLLPGHILMWEDLNNYWIDLTREVSKLDRYHDIISARAAKILTEGK